MSKPLNPLLRRLFRAPVWLYRWHCGRLLGRRFLLLTHVGRRTGLRRQTVLEVLEYRPDGPEAVVLSGWGRNADWLRNIQAVPHPEVTIGQQRFTASWRRLGVEEGAQALQHYEQRNRLMSPIIHAVLSRLLGWHYDGSAAARLRAVQQLPVIALRRRA